MVIDTALAILSLLGTGWTILIAIPRVTVQAYDRFNKWNETLDARFQKIEARQNSFEELVNVRFLKTEALESERQQNLNHKLELHSQQFSMVAGQLTETIKELQLTVKALHRRLDQIEGRKP